MARVSSPLDCTVATVGPMIGHVTAPALSNPTHPAKLITVPSGNAIGGGATVGQLFPSGYR